jgi:hypothetical protein
VSDEASGVAADAGASEPVREAASTPDAAAAAEGTLKDMPLICRDCSTPFVSSPAAFGHRCGPDPSATQASCTVSQASLRLALQVFSVLEQTFFAEHGYRIPRVRCKGATRVPTLPGRLRPPLRSAEGASHCSFA